jgi:cyanate permease
VQAPDDGTFNRLGFLTTPFMRIQTSGSTLTFALSWNASTYATTLLVRAMPSTTQFVHYCVTRKGSRYTLHENGTLFSVVIDSSTNTGSSNIFMGGGSGNTNSTDGYVDELRFTLGVARYAPSSFPLPVKRFPAQ